MALEKIKAKIVLRSISLRLGFYEEKIRKKQKNFQICYNKIDRKKSIVNLNIFKVTANKILVFKINV